MLSLSQCYLECGFQSLDPLHGGSKSLLKLRQLASKVGVITDKLLVNLNKFEKRAVSHTLWQFQSCYVVSTRLQQTDRDRVFNQGIIKGKVSLYHWRSVWLVWIQLYDNWQFLFLFAKQTNPNQSNRWSMVQSKTTNSFANKLHQCR